MAEIPPAGGPADVSSMLDAWLAEDQGAVAGDWSPVEPGTADASAEHPADAAETLPAAAPLLDAAVAGGSEAAAGESTPGDTGSNRPEQRTEPSSELSRLEQAEGTGAAARAWTPLAEFPPEPIEPVQDPAAGDLEVPPETALPSYGSSASAADLPAPDPAVESWLIDEQPPGGRQWTLPETESVAVPDGSDRDTVQAEPAGAIDALAQAEGLDEGLNEEQAAGQGDWTAVEAAAAPAIALSLEPERDVMPDAPESETVQAVPAAAIDAPAQVEGLDAWLNEEQAAAEGDWSSIEGAVDPAIALPPPESVAALPIQDEAPVEAPPASSASLFEAVSALDARSGEAAEPEAPPAGAAPDRSVQDRYVVFTVAGAQYAVQETFVTELDRVPKITTVPNVPAWVRGVTNRRGDILSVIEIRSLLGLDRIAAANERMLVVRLLDDSCSLGMLVDAVQQIVTVAAEDVRPPAATLEGVLAPFMRGVFEFNDKAVAVLDLDFMLRTEPVRQFDEPPDADEG